MTVTQVWVFVNLRHETAVPLVASWVYNYVDPVFHILECNISLQANLLSWKVNCQLKHPVCMNTSKLMQQYSMNTA